jgi:GABA permease
MPGLVPPKNLLVVATAPIEPERLRNLVREHAGAGGRVRIVAPAADVSPLQWLASDEDEARGQAEALARAAAEAVEPEPASVETQVGDPDPVQAIEDALRTFDADEIIVVTRGGDSAGWLEEGAAEAAVERFGLPVTHLAVD